jgi:hypothetical protein
MSADLGPPDIDWRDMQRCESEGHVMALWHRRVYDNGSIHIEFFCPRCDRPITRDRYETKGHSVTAEWFTAKTGLDPEQLPLHRRSLRVHQCYLCRRDDAQCEYHHVAPQAIYGKDAEKYPVVPLCKGCHDNETKAFTERLERYVQERIRRFLQRRGEVA